MDELKIYLALLVVIVEVLLHELPEIERVDEFLVDFLKIIGVLVVLLDSQLVREKELLELLPLKDLQVVRLQIQEEEKGLQEEQCQFEQPPPDYDVVHSLDFGRVSLLQKRRHFFSSLDFGLVGGEEEVLGIRVSLLQKLGVDAQNALHVLKSLFRSR